MATKAAPSLNPFALDAPELIQLIDAKAPRAIGSWRTLGGEEYGRSFAVAGTMGYDIIRDLHDGLLETFNEDGGTEKDFVNRMLPILREKGWLADKSEAQKARRLLLIYDTNLRTGQAVGRWARIQATKAALPYLYGFTARDERVRHPPKSQLHDHRAFEGILLPVDHPFWESYFPPLGFRCRCQVVQKTRSQALRLGSETSKLDLLVRMERLGRPFGFNPGRDSLEGVLKAAGRANDKRLEGAPPLNPLIAQAKAKAIWDKAMAGQSAKAKQEFQDPINRKVNADTIKIEPKAKVIKRLEVELAQAAARPEYNQLSEFGDRSPGDWGKAVFSDEFDDKTVSMIAALKPELDDLARQIGVPPIRGFKSIKSGSRSNANQGDGVMGINPKTFGERAARIGTGKPTPKTETLIDERFAVNQKLLAARDEADEVQRQLDELATRFPEFPSVRTRPGGMALILKRSEAMRKLEELQRKEFELTEAIYSFQPPSKWKPGDNPLARPWTVADYQAEGVDKARSTLIHEFGHHVHQYLFKNGVNRNVNKPPLEKTLKEMYSNYRRSKTRKGRSPSRYSEEDQFEWFVENFSTYVMGRKDLVDDKLKDLIERLFRREYAPPDAIAVKYF